MWNGINKRRFPRVNYQCSITIKEGSGAEKIETHTENVGVGGICVILRRGLNIFDEVGLRLSLENKARIIHCKGRIVWRVKREELKGKRLYDTGIEFINLKTEDKEYLDKAIGSL